MPAGLFSIELADDHGNSSFTGGGVDWSGLKENENYSLVNVCYKGHGGFTSLAVSYFSGFVLDVLGLDTTELGVFLLFGCEMSPTLNMGTTCELLSSRNEALDFIFNNKMAAWSQAGKGGAVT